MTESEGERYYFVMYSWWTANDLDKLTKELGARFTVLKPFKPQKKLEIGEFWPSLYEIEFNTIEIQADTLYAYLSPYKAILFQKKKAPFTSKDLDLRKTIMSLYTHSRASAFPFNTLREPKFETVESGSHSGL
jgi:hypothetical protein